MKQRILELLSSPENIAAEDLTLLKEEIAVQPYAQSLRALYLLGTKKYDADNFQTILSTTAAYTTDKKILYQFINGKIYQTQIPDLIVENSSLELEASPAVSKDDETIVNEAVLENLSGDEKVEEEGNWISALPKKAVPEKVILEGEVNRILFPGEENFLNEENSVQIDLESTQESGVLVAERVDAEANESAALVEKSPEKFKEDLLALNSDLNGENPTDSPDKELSLMENNSDVIDNDSIMNEPVENILIEVETDLPIKNEVVENKLNTKTAPENKYETERKRLAEQVELIMSQSKKPTSESMETEAVEENDATVDFFQTQEFSLGKADIQNPDVKIDVEKKQDLEIASTVSEEPENVAVNRIEDDSAENSNWKPMQAADQTASNSRFSKIEDTLISEPVDVVEEKKENATIEEQSQIEAEVEPLHISFFAPTITSMEKKDEKIEEQIQIEKPVEQISESNVPTFINTWQSWLKLDRSAIESVELKEDDSKEKIKSEAIDKFIDAAPKISKLKEESTFTVKEKKDDIAHLTTETLAKLFLSQKLYAKAINAYKILQQKYPEKTAEFDERIAEIKVLRQK